MLLEPQRKWDCFWPKRAISGSPIYPLAIKFLKKCAFDINSTWYFYLGSGTSLGTTPNAQICTSWLPGLRLRWFKACRTSLWNVGDVYLIYLPIVSFQYRPDTSYDLICIILWFWFWMYVATTTLKSQWCISWLHELRFRPFKACRTSQYNIWVHILPHCPGMAIQYQCDIFH